MRAAYLILLIVASKASLPQLTGVLPFDQPSRLASDVQAAT